jgi:hypothetical protein
LEETGVKHIDTATSKKKHYTTYPSSHQYKRLADACIKSLVEYVGTHKNRLRIDLKMPAYLRLPKTFPKATKARYLEGGKSYNVQDVLWWLCEKGFADITPDQIEHERRSLVRKIDWIDRKFDLQLDVTKQADKESLDVDQNTEYNFDIENFEEEG